MPGADHPRSTGASLFRYCPLCGTPLRQRERSGHLRPICPACGYVQWRNPAVGVAAILRAGEVATALGGSVVRGPGDPGAPPRPGDVLLVRRAQGERSGLWCIPCGYVEFDEDVREAVVRETEEETGLRIRPGAIRAVLSNFHDPDRQTVGIWFEAAPLGGSLRPGDDVDALGFYDPGDPGVMLAFPTDAEVLRDLARDAPEEKRS